MDPRRRFGAAGGRRARPCRPTRRRSPISRSGAPVAHDGSPTSPSTMIVGAPLDRLGSRPAADRTLAAPRRADRASPSPAASPNTFSATSSRNSAISPSCWRANCAQQLSRRTGLPLIDPGQRIRATVIGASQFTVQVSGKTIYLPEPAVSAGPQCAGACMCGSTLRPIEIDGIRLVASRRRSTQIDLDPGARVAIAFAWAGDPEHARLKAVGQAIIARRGAEGRRDRAAAADDRRRCRQDARPLAASRTRPAPATSSRSTACSCRSSISSMSAN